MSCVHEHLRRPALYELGKDLKNTSHVFSTNTTYISANSSTMKNTQLSQLILMQNLCHSIEHISRNIYPHIFDRTVTYTIIYEHQENDSENLRTPVF